MCVIVSVVVKKYWNERGKFKIEIITLMSWTSIFTSEMTMVSNLQTFTNFLLINMTDSRWLPKFPSFVPFFVFPSVVFSLLLLRTLVYRFFALPEKIEYSLFSSRFTNSSEASSPL